MAYKACQTAGLCHAAKISPQNNFVQGSAYIPTAIPALAPRHVRDNYDSADNWLDMLARASSLP